MSNNAAAWVVVSLMIAAVAAATFIFHRKRWYHWERVTANRLAGGVFGNKALLVVRGVLAFYIVGIWFYIVTIKPDKSGNPPNGKHVIRAFGFYTVWNFTMLMVYFVMAFIQSIRHHIKGTADDKTPSRKLFDRSTFVLFQICATMVILVDVVLWGVLYPHAYKACHPSDGTAPDCTQVNAILNFGSYNVHLFNLFFIMIEFVMNRMVIVPAHVSFVGVWLMCYGAYSWIRAADGRGWVYFFMDLGAKNAWLWYLGLGVLHALFFLLAFGLSKLKQRVTKDKYDADVEVQYLMTTDGSVA
jgi:hypothetical protein